MPRTAGLTVRIFTHERAHVRRRRAAEALVELAQERRLADVTMTRGLAEAAPGDVTHDGALVSVEMADRVERIEAALPQIAALTPRGAFSITQTRIYLPASRLRASDAMEQPASTARPDDPADDALHALFASGARLIPVFDTERRPVGDITLTHLLGRLDGDSAAQVLQMRQAERMRERLALHIEGMRVRDLMRSARPDRAR